MYLTTKLQNTFNYGSVMSDVQAKVVFEGLNPKMSGLAV